MLRSSPQLQQVLQGVATVAQMTLLKPVTHADAAESSQHAHVTAPDGSADSVAAEGSICVVNSHFFFHPRASHVRNIHAAAVMSEVKAFIEETASVSAGCSDKQATAATATTAPSAGPTASSHNTDQSSSPGAELGGSQQPALLFCGDLNSDLNDGTPGSPT